MPGRKREKQREKNKGELTAPQELQVLSLWPEAPHLGQSVPCILTLLYFEIGLDEFLEAVKMNLILVLMFEGVVEK